MQIELKLANPKSAKVAIVIERGSSAALCGPSMEKATSSFNTMRVPRRLPMAGQSRHGVPMTHAMGANNTPKICCRLEGNHIIPRRLCIPPSTPLARGITAGEGKKHDGVCGG